MNATLPCRLFIDAAASGAWNMAVDEVLLDTAAERGIASLRFYGWGEPTLSLGYFQSFRDRRSHSPSRDCPLVRRQTGGGAILHDRELTYCLAVPVAHPLAVDATRLYLAVHEALVSTLAGFDIATTLRARSDEARAGQEPFMCFQRRTRGDVLFGEIKVCGSAQRRRRGAVLQHGSLLLAASPRAPELPGIAELAGKNLASKPLIESWGIEICSHLHMDGAAGTLSAVELAEVRAMALEKYDSAGWTRRR